MNCQSNGRVAGLLQSLRRVSTGVACVVPLVLAACGGDATSPSSHAPHAARPNPAGLPTGQCLGQLSGRGVDYRRIDDFGSRDGCGITTAIELTASTAVLNQPATLGCPLALALNDYERQVLQPLAQRYFGQHVARIHHLGAYSCRARSGNSGRLSEHAKGRAIDISAFELADGTIIRVETDWHGRGDRRRFVRAAARGACDLFQVVLSPNHDRAHHDHLHFDIGPWRLCKP